MEKMSYRQMSTKEVRPVEELKKVECEKTGTIFYEHPVTKERQWAQNPQKKMKNAPRSKPDWETNNPITAIKKFLTPKKLQIFSIYK